MPYPGGEGAVYAVVKIKHYFFSVRMCTCVFARVIRVCRVCELTKSTSYDHYRDLKGIRVVLVGGPRLAKVLW